MKKRSGKNLIRFFYHLLVVLVMAMPMLSGLVRIIYVQANQNAKDSYYGDTINSSSVSTFNVEQLQLNFVYDLNYVQVPSESTSMTYHYYIRCNYIKYDGVVVDDAKFLYFWYNYGSYAAILRDAAFTTNIISYTGTAMNLLSFEFISLVENGNGNNFLDNVDIFNTIVYNDYSFIDNVFDYSIFKTMQDFTFHSDFRFTDIANGMLMTFDNNNLYIQYINFYINWVLTTAVISFAPYVLLSFYHLAIGLLDKFMKKGEDL